MTMILNSFQVPDLNGGGVSAMKQQPASQQTFQKSFIKLNHNRSTQSLMVNNIKPLSSSASIEDSLSSSSLPKIDTESERIKHCGNLFDRRSTINQELLQEFFRKEPCPYGTYLFYIISLNLLYK